MAEYRFEDELKNRIAETEKIIASFLPQGDCAQKKILEAVAYSVLAGGKRLRPLIMREVYRLTRDKLEAVQEDTEPVTGRNMACGTDLEERILHPFMAALEFIHTYSLVHDDLPAMDNDMLRRGKPTTHAAFGEAMGILAGDGLLNYAFEIVSHIDLEGLDAEIVKRIYESMGILSRYAGVYGMIGGQVLDIYGYPEVQKEQLVNLYRLKTSGLIKSATAIGAVLAGADEETTRKLTEYADLLGIAFQVRDDILDMTSTEEELGKSVGQDESNNKTTLAKFLGPQEADRYVNELTDRALAILGDVFDSVEASFLKELTSYLSGRKY